jgi:hypothetical protein
LRRRQIIIENAETIRETEAKDQQEIIEHSRNMITLSNGEAQIELVILGNEEKQLLKGCKKKRICYDQCRRERNYVE